MCPCSKVKTVFGREFKSYFDSPVAYVFLVAFLVLVGFLTFGVAMFYERRQADLTPFFFWHPWVYLLLVPAAITMLLGAVLAVFSVDLKRTLACSSMSQIGFILTGVSMCFCSTGRNRPMTLGSTL